MRRVVSQAVRQEICVDSDTESGGESHEEGGVDR